MKKFAVLLLTLALLCSAALAETAFVTITNGQGEICLAWEDVEVSDIDGDGALTIYDALYCAHEAYFDGGADAGFAAEDQGYGPSLVRLWGEENGGSYGYCLDNVPAVSLADPIDGDENFTGIAHHIHAYAYQDLEAWSDQFSYFEWASIDAARGLSSLTLKALSYDADWNAVSVPVADAKLIINGEDSGLVTDENGCVVIDASDPDSSPMLANGENIFTAIYDGAVLVPPVFRITSSR